MGFVASSTDLLIPFAAISLPAVFLLGIFTVVRLVESALVKEALAITNGNQVKASDLLGVNRATLRKKAAE